MTSFAKASAESENRSNETRSTVRLDRAGSLPPLWLRFFGYLSADGLTYLLGFAIYGWLIRSLTDAQYGQLSIATSIYQVLMMIAALGLDLIGPRLIAEAGGDPMRIVQRGQWLRLAVALGICGPITGALAMLYWHRDHAVAAAVVAAGFAMVLVRTVDVSYLAVALGMPGALARTRALGLGFYLVALLVLQPVVTRTLWIVPLLNAIGLYVGRMQLWRILRRHAHAAARAPHRQISTSEMMRSGMKASSGMLLLLCGQTLDVLLLAKYVPAESVGQYAMVSRLYLFGTAVLTCLLNTFLPELVAAANDAELLRKRFHMFLLASASLGLLGAAVLWTAGARACEILGHRHLAIARQVAPLYALVFLVMAICNPFLSLLPSLRKTGSYVWAIAGAAALLGGVDLLLVPRFGPAGAASGQLIATVLLTVLGAAAYFSYVRGLQRPLAIRPAHSYSAWSGWQR